MSRPLSEKEEWMHQAGIREFKNPMKYYDAQGNLYSEEYIKNTPLEELKVTVNKNGNLVTRQNDRD